MKIADSLKDLFTRSSTVAPSNSAIFVGRLNGSVITPTGIISAGSALANSDIYAITSLISNDIAAMSFSGPDNITSILNKPNQYTNQFSFWQMVVNELLMYGNAYCAINKDNNGNFIGLEFLRDEQIMNIQIQDGSKDIFYEVMFNDGREDTTLFYSSSEMLHFKLSVLADSTSTQLFGRSPLMALTPELNTQALSNRLITETLKNGISPSVMITVPEAQVSNEAKVSIRQSFIDSTSGDNMGQPIVVDQSATVQKIGISPEVSEFLKNIDFTKTQISKAFGVNVAMINGDGDSQSSIDMVQAQYQQSIARYKNAIQYELSMKLGAPILLGADLTDDQLIARYSGLVGSNIMQPEDAANALRQKGII